MARHTRSHVYGPPTRPREPQQRTRFEPKTSRTERIVSGKATRNAAPLRSERVRLSGNGRIDPKGPHAPKSGRKRGFFSSIAPILVKPESV